MGWGCMAHMGEKCIMCLVAGPKGKKPPCRSMGEDNIQMDLKAKVWMVWTGFIWLKKGSSAGLVCKRYILY